MKTAEAEDTEELLWNACVKVLAQEKKPLEVWRVAQACELTEEEVIATLIRHAGKGMRYATFRYPPLPCAAIVNLKEIE